MERKRITCPVFAHLEEIEMESTPFGIVVDSCTRFSPSCAVNCACECARLMDRRERLRSADDYRERVLVVYADADTRRLADQLAPVLEQEALVVELADATTRGVPPPQDYDAVVVVAPFHRRRLARSTADYVSSHRDALAEMPSFFVPISTRNEDDLPAGEAGAAVATITGWSPTFSAAIAVHARTHANVDTRIRALATMIADEIPGTATA